MAKAAYVAKHDYKTSVTLKHVDLVTTSAPIVLPGRLSNLLSEGRAAPSPFRPGLKVPKNTTGAHPGHWAEI